MPEIALEEHILVHAENL